MLNSWLEIILWKSVNAKMTQNGLPSQNCIFWLQPYRCFQKSPRNLRGIFYQMDHIWWAPSRLNKSPRFKMRSQLSHTLFHSLIVTLYIDWVLVRRNKRRGKPKPWLKILKALSAPAKAKLAFEAFAFDIMNSYRRRCRDSQVRLVSTKQV